MSTIKLSHGCFINMDYFIGSNFRPASSGHARIDIFFKYCDGTKMYFDGNICSFCIDGNEAVEAALAIESYFSDPVPAKR